MAQEIERKFLVKNMDFIKDCYHKYNIKQGFLNSNKNRVVRVRIQNEKSFLTIKGRSNSTGTTRFEWETEIPLHEGSQLFSLCEENRIEKVRYLVKQDAHIFEIDVFSGKNKGLIIAEIELESEHEVFEKPSWIGEEVTGIPMYYNTELSKNPFENWQKKLGLSNE